jgi:predicted nucleic acid-binding protein
MTKPALWYVSDAIVSEYAVVLARPELKIRMSLRQQLLQLIKNHTRVVSPSRLAQVTSDLGDNMFVECADAASGRLHGDWQPAPFPKVLEGH